VLEGIFIMVEGEALVGGRRNSKLVSLEDVALE
jgi:hypothetical protein